MFQDVWNWILAVLPNNNPDTANAIAAWIQGIATTVALGFSVVLLRLTLHALRHQQGESAEAARPRVIFDYYQADGQRPSSFVARNVGEGAALNAYFFERDPRDDQSTFIPLGGMLAHQEINLATDVAARLNREVTANGTDRVPLFILAEAAVGGDWMLSLNRVIANSRMSHEVMRWTPPDSLLKKLKALTIDERLRQLFQEMTKAKTDAAAGVQ